MIDLNIDFVGMDLETTGVDPFADDFRIVQWGGILQDCIGNNKDLEYVMNPGVEVPTNASNIHGYTTEYLREFGDDYNESLQSIADTVSYSIQNKIPIVMYNGSFDATGMRCEFLRTGIDFDDNLWEEMILLDAMVQDKFLEPFRKGGQKLGRVAELYGYDLTNAHDALEDIRATLHVTRLIVPKFIEKVEKKYNQPVESYQDLNTIQKMLYLEQKTSLETYFRTKGGKGSDFTINKSWPFQSAGCD